MRPSEPSATLVNRRQPAHQVELLEDHADPGAGLAHVAVDAAVLLHRPVEGLITPGAGVDGLQGADRAQQGRLARAGGPDQGDHLALADVQRDPVERRRWPKVLEAFRIDRTAASVMGRSELSRHQACARLRGSAMAPARLHDMRACRGRLSARRPARGRRTQHEDFTSGSNAPISRGFRRTRCPQKRC